MRASSLYHHNIFPPDIPSSRILPVNEVRVARHPPVKPTGWNPPRGARVDSDEHCQPPVTALIPNGRGFRNLVFSLTGDRMVTEKKTFKAAASLGIDADTYPVAHGIDRVLRTLDL